MCVYKLLILFSGEESDFFTKGVYLVIHELSKK